MSQQRVAHAKCPARPLYSASTTIILGPGLLQEKRWQKYDIVHTSLSHTKQRIC